MKSSNRQSALLRQASRVAFTLAFFILAANHAQGQTNTFPASGNVGIGTTTPGAALNVSTGSVLLGATTTNLNQASCKLIMRVAMNQNLCFESSSNANTAALGVANDANTAFADFQLNANNLLFFGNNVERMRITSTGNVGIGTTNPAVKLHSQVSSPNTGTPTGSDMGVFINNSDTTANNYALIGFGNALPQFQAAIGSVNLGSGANAGGHLVFHTRPAAGATAERMRIDSSGKVGIGTTAPGGKLHIYDVTAGVELIGRIQHGDDSSASSNSIWRVISGNLGTSKLEFTSSSFWRAAIWSGANKDLQFYTGGQPSAATERMRILDTGTIGIGTATPNASYKLDVNGAINATAVNVNGSPINGSQWTTSGTTINYGAGNVGIGTSTPSQALDVNGSVVISGTGRRIFGNFFDAVANRTFFQSYTTNTPTIVGAIPSGSGTTSGYVVYNSSDPVNASLGGFTVAVNDVRFISGKNGTGSFLPLLFEAGGSERMRIDGTGNIGIGTSSPGVGGITSSTYLTLASSGSNRPAFEFVSNLSDGAGKEAGFLEFVFNTNSSGHKRIGNISVDTEGATANQRGGVMRFFTKPNASATMLERMRIDAAGTVGIGTASPNASYKLDVNGAVNATALNVNGTPVTSSQWASGSGNINYTSGNVGIGTASPNVSYKLDVNGPVNATALNVNGTPVTSSQWASGSGNINYTSGNVGIGTASPNASYKLDVNGPVNATALNVNGSPVTSSQWTTSGANINYAPAGNVGIGTSAPTEKFHVTGNGKITGNLTVDGTINAKYQDVAEWVPSSEQLSAGTVVVLDQTKSNQVISSTISYDTRVAGVISEQPGITLGESGAGKVLVATTGRVRVKVDATRAPIQIGDLLVTSDVIGVAMKSEAVNLGGVQIHRPGTIIGKALEPLAKGKGAVLVLLSLQ